MPKEIARAKINLNLHVGRTIDEPESPHHGYHPLSSLVAFADYGDELFYEQARETSLEISGPFAKGLKTDAENLVLKAYNRTAEFCDLPKIKFHLIKNLPTASGIGGGSADAAAALRLLKNFASLDGFHWREIALSLGADVPVCFYSKTCIMSGIGEKLEFLSSSEILPVILVNAGEPVSTKNIFRMFDQTNTGREVIQAAGSLFEKASAGRNDLQAVAIDQAPIVGQCLEVLSNSKQVRLARMSGSGGTCFGIFETWTDANHAAQSIARGYPHWWVRPVMLGDQP